MRTNYLAVFAATALAVVFASNAEARARAKNRCVDVETEAPARDGITPPVAIRRVQPRYPLNSQMDEVGGLIIVSYTVNADGTVADAKIVCADPRKRFEAAALDAIREWRFQPAQQRGQPVAYPSMSMHFYFGIKGAVGNEAQAPD